MSEKQHGMMRKFNRLILNPIMKLFAGRFFYSLVYHTGRRSGKVYSTPVIAVRNEQSIYCPLPYGADTDWYLNVKAADKCEIKINGKVYSGYNPEIVNETTALPNFSSGLKKAFISAKIKKYLRLKTI